LNSNNNKSRLSNSDPELSISNNRYSSKDKLGYSEYPIGLYKQVMLASIQGGGKVVGIDFQEAPKYNSSRNTYIFEYHIN
jgi:hypothetical protein